MRSPQNIDSANKLSRNEVIRYILNPKVRIVAFAPIGSRIFEPEVGDESLTATNIVSHILIQKYCKDTCAIMYNTFYYGKTEPEDLDMSFRDYLDWVDGEVRDKYQGLVLWQSRFESMLEDCLKGKVAHVKYFALLQAYVNYLAEEKEEVFKGDQGKLKAELVNLVLGVFPPSLYIHAISPEQYELDNEYSEDSDFEEWEEKEEAFDSGINWNWGLDNND